MTKQSEEKSLLAEIIGTEITIPTASSSREENNNVLKILSDDLYNNLVTFLESSAPFFQATLPLERLIKYKDGSFSSIEKAINGGFGRHQGFSLLSSFRIAGDIMSHVIPKLNARLTAIYSDLINRNNDLLNHIQDAFVTPEISKLKSIQEFLCEVSCDIEEISRSQQLSTATLTNLQQRRIDLKAIFHMFLSRLGRSVVGQSFDPQDIAANYLTARHALSGYMASLILECIISGNIDNNSVANLRSKLVDCLEKLNSITNELYFYLNNRQYQIQGEIRDINSLYGWTYDLLTQSRVSALHAQGCQIESLKSTALKEFDIDLELKCADQFIAARRSLLENIQIMDQCSARGGHQISVVS